MNNGNGFDIIATLNTTNLEKTVIRSLVENGATIFRLNGAFLNPPLMSGIIAEIRGAVEKRAKVLIDLPGFKIRFLYLPDELAFRKGTVLTLSG